jgi:hypothetical protein
VKCVFKRSCRGNHYGDWSTARHKVWSRFFLDVLSVTSLVILVPVIIGGRPWQRVIACVLAVFPALSLYESLAYLHIKAH